MQGEKLNLELPYEYLDYSESFYVMPNQNTQIFRGTK